MAYKKFIKYKRGAYNSGTKKRKPTVRALAKSVNKLQRKAYVTEPEKNYLVRNSVVNNALITTGGIIHSLTALSNTQRIGQEFTLLKAHFRGYLRWNDVNSGGVVTMFVLKANRQVTDTYPSFANVWSGGDSNYGFEVESKSKAFTILYKKRFVQHGDIREIPLDFKVPVSGIRVKWNGSTGTDIEDDGIYMFLQSNEGSNQPIIALNEQLVFYDN